MGSKDFPDGLSALDEHLQRECIEYMRRRNRLFLEAAISCMMDTETVLDTARILRQHADQLEEYG